MGITSTVYLSFLHHQFTWKIAFIPIFALFTSLSSNAPLENAQFLFDSKRTTRVSLSLRTWLGPINRLSSDWRLLFLLQRLMTRKTGAVMTRVSISQLQADLKFHQVQPTAIHKTHSPRHSPKSPYFVFGSDLILMPCYSSFEGLWTRQT